MVVSRDLSALLKNLFATQRFAVLATQSKGQPYGALVAFAATSDLTGILFATGRDSRKYSDAMESGRVAILIDNRMNQTTDFTTAVAVTATGAIMEVVGKERDHVTEVYLSKHPDLADFVKDPVRAMMEIKVAEYVVASFDKVQRFRIGTL